jgi:hypothetical protein
MVLLFMTIFSTEVTLYVIPVSANFSHMSIFAAKIANDIRVVCPLLISVVGVRPVVVGVSSPGIIVTFALENARATVIFVVGVRTVVVSVTSPGIIAISALGNARATAIYLDVMVTLVITGVIVSTVAIVVTAIVVTGAVVTVVVTVAFT